MADEIKYFELLNRKIFVDSNEILDNDRIIKLSPKEMGVLVALYHNRGSTVSRTNLLEVVWGSPYGNDLGLTQAVSKLRRVFNDDSKNSKLIKTIPKKGYQLLITTNESNDAKIKQSNIFTKYYSLKKFQKIARNIIILLVVVMLLLQLFDIRIRIEQLAT